MPTSKKTVKKSTKSAKAPAKKVAKQGSSSNNNILATVAAVLGLVAVLLVPVQTVEGLSPLVAAIACVLVIICICRGDEGWRVFLAAFLAIFSFAMVVMMQWMGELDNLNNSIDRLTTEETSQVEEQEETTGDATENTTESE